MYTIGSKWGSAGHLKVLEAIPESTPVLFPPSHQPLLDAERCFVCLRAEVLPLVFLYNTPAMEKARCTTGRAARANCFIIGHVCISTKVRHKLRASNKYVADYSCKCKLYDVVTWINAVVHGVPRNFSKPEGCPRHAQG